MAKQKGYVVILAGGGGTRLWPLSRRKLPKQFLKLINKKTLFQDTFSRIKDKFSISHIYVVTNKAFVQEIKKEVPQMLSGNIISEPSGKNTAAAAGLAASIIYKKDPRAVITTLASDHFIKEKGKFLKVLLDCQEAARKEDAIVTMGIKPTQAHTGLGYIHIDGEVFRVGRTTVFRVESFKEKPNAVTASAYFASGEFFWNANINSYKASTLLEAIREHMPRLSKVLSKLKERQGDGRVFDESWDSLTSESIDTGILEKANNILMIPGNFSWFDVGDWSSIYDLMAASKGQNIRIGETIDHLNLDTEGCLIHGNNKLIATFGVKDMMIVDTEDVLLVCPKEKAQEVKKLVSKLQKNKRSSYL